MAQFFAKFDGPGLAIAQIEGGDPDYNRGLARQGFRSIEIPKGFEFGDWSGVELLLDPKDGIKFHWEPHVRRWADFRDELTTSASAQQLEAASTGREPLRTAQTRLVSALTALENTPNSTRLSVFQARWAAVREEVMALPDGTVPSDTIANLEAIAEKFNIPLTASSEEVEEEAI